MLGEMAILPSPARAATLYVGGGGSGNYTRIVDAIAAAVSGDSVFVYPGTYAETVYMKPGVSLVGQSPDTTTINGRGSYAVVMSTWANVSGFTLTMSSAAVFVNMMGGDCDCRIADNRITSSDVAIFVNASANVSISNNSMVDSGISFESGYSGQLRHWNTHTIDDLNTMNGRPVVYWKDAVGGTVPSGAGQVILANVTGVTVEGQNLGPTSAAIQLGFSRDVRIENNTIMFSARNPFYPYGGAVGLYYSDANTLANNTIADSGDGVYIWESANNILHNNTIRDSDANGVELAGATGTRIMENVISWNRRAGVLGGFRTDGTVIANNTFASNLRGIWIGGDANEVVSNTVETGQDGILVGGGSGNLVARNTASGNSGRGIEVDGGSLNTVAGNTATQNGGPGIQLYQTRSNVVLSNTVTFNRDGIFLGSGTSDNLVRNNTVADNLYGITLYLSTRDTGERNNVSHNSLAGVTVGMSSLATLTENRIARNAYDTGGNALYGVYLDQSTGVLVHHNNIEGNTRQAYDNTGNRWDDGYPSGGNHWSDYAGLDNCSGPLQNVCPDPDGIGDTPYAFSSAQDRYPLIQSTSPVPIPPSEPWELRATPGDARVSLAWSPPLDDGGSPVTNYRVYRGTTAGGEAFLAEIGPVLTYTDAGLSNGQTYFYRVSAKNAAGEGPQSTETSATPVTVPGPPTAVQAVVAGRDVTLTWSPPADDGGSPVTSYRTYRGTAPGAESLLRAVGAVGTFLDAGLAVGTTYYYRISAVNAVGEGPRSLETSATVPNQPPACAITAPGPGTTVSGTYSIAGTSSDPDGTVLRVEVSIDNGSWGLAGQTNPWRYDWPTQAFPDGAHTIRARAYDGTDYSAVASVTVTVRNAAPPPPPPPEVPPWQQPWVVGILAGTTIAAVLALLVLLRKRKRREPKS